ncbi:DoxX family membrane protein [Luteimonas vadosa]|uniref:DoxX family protein n=1 Tax=Luteimonas vadosa TaxID=1165507 RepID=A0ABP9DXH2_9GAMM
MLTPDVLPHWHLPEPRNAATLLLRLMLGLMWLAHGLVLKLMTYGIAGSAAWLASIGLPSALALPLILAETLGGTLILLGLHGRRASLALLPILLGALWFHAGKGWVFSNPDGGWEYPLFLVFASVLHLILGDGKYAVRPESR